jgi:spore cortex formation protein SpoVR/YcgB (stage V sporulation)
MNRLYEKGLVIDGSMLEFMHMHSAVVYQPAFSDRGFSGFNPYALGFAMMRDIKRICVEPTDEDRQWFPDIAGNGQPMETLKDAWANFRDESFIHQFLSPKVIRDFRIFHIRNKSEDHAVRVEAIHDEMGYRDVRRLLARQYDVSQQDPDIQVTDADLSGSRRLVLTHFVRDGILLDKDECDRTLMHVARLWGFRVRLVEVDNMTGAKLREHETLPLP